MTYLNVSKIIDDFQQGIEVYHRTLARYLYEIIKITKFQ